MRNIKEELTLAGLPAGKTAVISSVNCEDKALRRHILNMGLIPGVEVTLIKTAPMGNPLQISLRGYELTLRKEDAAKIKIQFDGAKNTSKNQEINTTFQDTERSQIGESLTYETRKTGKGVLKTKINLALAGNQNSGKTTLFNQLTGLNQHVGNFPGVTVDRTDGIIKNYQNVTITDLPGIYSLSPYSSEEIVTRNFILNEKPDGIINIVDASNIERNLFLTLQLIELDVPMVIALNMMDEVYKSGGSIDVNGLEAALGVPVIPISASKNEGIEELIEHAVNVAKYQEHPGRLDFCDPNDKNSGSIHICIHSIIHLIGNHAKNANIPVRFAATKLAEGDSLILKSLNLEPNEIEICDEIIAQMEEERGLDKEAALADMRFSFIEKLCGSYVKKPVESAGHKISAKADKILTGKYTAIFTFLAIMALIFYLTFGPLGSFCSELTEKGIEYLTDITDKSLTSYGLNPIVRSLVIDGIYAGVGSVLSFLPVIVILFFFLSILEDSGYMARVAFIMDKILRKIGLSGRSFVPMLIGFGCSVPAIMATRTLPSERDRKITILLTPFMSCSAKLPIYAFFTAAFFKENQVIVIISLYLIGIITGIIFAYVLKYFVFRGQPVPFVMELPNYRMPSPSNVFRLIYMKSKDFVTRAFTIIFAATIIIWFLQSFDSRLNLVTNSADSMLASLGNIIIPIFKPLGISDWRISTAFITGFMAKESVVSTLTVLMGGDTDKLPELFTGLTAFVFLVFSLLYTPCVAAIATVRRELGKRYAALVVLLQCSIAWFAAFLVYIFGCMFVL
ncbi:MAG: ferrous iron transport protein B [Candidatus Gastranaerophilales bacterium]|nr:ferrous iron transport protein B [Candidatus Gastranaerophilales bacterium]